MSEVREGDKNAYYNGYQHLKQNIDNRTMIEKANPKYGKMRDEMKAYSVFIFSNHKDAMKIDKDDRRLMVVEYAGKRKSVEFYRALEAEMRDERNLAALYHWYMKRDVSNFDPIHAPMTDAKRAMMDLGKRSGSGNLNRWVKRNFGL